MVPEDLTNVVAVAGGGSHSLALRADGTVIAWGAGTNRLGVSPNFGQAIVPDGLTNVVELAGGSYHSLALRADGSLAAWVPAKPTPEPIPITGSASFPRA